MGNGEIAKPGASLRSVPTSVLLVLVIGLGVGFAAGWFSRSAATTLPELVIQKGSISLAGAEEKEIFYPRPYSSPPALKMSPDNVLIIEQRANGFKVRNRPKTLSATCEWQAEGVPAK